MTLPAPIRKARDRNTHYHLQTILILGQHSETRGFFREALATNGYRVLEAANYQHADAIVRQTENRLDLILGCSHSDQELSSIEAWHTSHFAVPLLVVRSTDPCAGELSAEEIECRVRLALQTAHRSTSILVVDEDKSERRMIAEVLNHAGYRVIQASNGNEALALLAKDPPDLLLTDIVMPEKDGLELIQQVRKHYLKTAIVAMSGTSRADGYLSVARLLGAKCTLKKPLSVSQLIQALRAAPGADA